MNSVLWNVLCDFHSDCDVLVRLEWK